MIKDNSKCSTISNSISNSIYIYILSVINNIIKNKDYKLLGKFLTTNLIVLLSKKLLPAYSITLRPDNSCKCSFFEDKNKPQPGFPSGHSTNISFIVFNYLKTHKPNLFKKIITIQLILLMGWSRWNKRCHTRLQIAAGVINGAVCASL